MSVTASPTLRVPGDKSISHRALMLAALADGTSRVAGVLPGEDPRSTADALRAFGVRVPEIPGDGGVMVIQGVGLRGLEPPSRDIDCGNSGTTARLLLGLLSGFPFSATLTGDASLRSRPMRRVTQPLTAMGASFEELGEPDRLPIRVMGGALRPLEYDSPRASAQVKSALLLAGLTGGVSVTVREPTLSRDHTERMLRAMGVRVVSSRLPDGRAVAELEPAASLTPLEGAVPGDFSSAAFLLCAALLAGRGEVRLEGVGVNPTRAGLLPVLERMGAAIEVNVTGEALGEPVADLVVRPAQLRGTEVGGGEVPSLIDEIPVLAAIAARAEGETRITGAEELRVKESDRIAVLVENLTAIGVEAHELPDGLVIRGTGRPLRGVIRAHDDHRIAMAFGVLGACPGNEIRVDQPDVVAVSYPGFWSDLARCTGYTAP